MRREAQRQSVHIYSFPILMILYIVPTAEQTLHWTCCLHWLISSKGEKMINCLNFFLFSYYFADFHHYADILPKYAGIFRKFNNNVLFLELLTWEQVHLSLLVLMTGTAVMVMNCNLQYSCRSSLLSYPPRRQLMKGRAQQLMVRGAASTFWLSNKCIRSK